MRLGGEQCAAESGRLWVRILSGVRDSRVGALAGQVHRAAVTQNSFVMSQAVLPHQLRKPSLREEAKGWELGLHPAESCRQFWQPGNHPRMLTTTHAVTTSNRKPSYYPFTTG